MKKEFLFPPKAKIGYFALHGYKYNSNQNVMEFMQKDCDYNISEIRSVLASMGFKQNDIGKSLSVLSGGEIIKLLSLLKMLMGRYNILIMDEPSNFLGHTKFRGFGNTNEGAHRN